MFFLVSAQSEWKLKQSNPASGFRFLFFNKKDGESAFYADIYAEHRMNSNLSFVWSIDKIYIYLVLQIEPSSQYTS